MTAPTLTCAAGPVCPGMRQTWQSGELRRFACERCGRTCSMDAAPARGTAIVMPAPLLLRSPVDQVGAVA